jgi:hypothetical protein
MKPISGGYFDQQPRATLPHETILAIQLKVKGISRALFPRL